MNGRRRCQRRGRCFARLDTLHIVVGGAIADNVAIGTTMINVMTDGDHPFHLFDLCRLFSVVRQRYSCIDRPAAKLATA